MRGATCEEARSEPLVCVITRLEIETLGTSVLSTLNISTLGFVNRPSQQPPPNRARAGRRSPLGCIRSRGALLSCVLREEVERSVRLLGSPTDRSQGQSA